MSDCDRRDHRPLIDKIAGLTRHRIDQLMETIMILDDFRSDDGEAGGRDTEGDSEQALWIMALRSWAAAKTSGFGYSLYLSGNRLSGAVMVNFMPFFLPVLCMNRSRPDMSMRSDINENQEGQGDLTQMLVPEVDESTKASAVRVAMGAVDEVAAESDTCTRQPQVACSA